MSRRRALASLLAIGASACLRVHAQQVRHVGVLMGYAQDDPEAQERLAAFNSAMASLGWMEGRNLKTSVRWGAGDASRAEMLAHDLLALRPDVVLTNTTPASVAMHRVTTTIPIIFTVVSDPVGSGLVTTLSRPGGNLTGLINLEASLAGKWLQLLKEAAPGIVRVTTMFNPQTAPYAPYYLGTMNTVAAALGITLSTRHVASDAQIVQLVEEIGREKDSGLIVMTDSFLTVHRRTVIEICARHKVPAVYFASVMARDGGLISYGPDVSDLFRRAARFVDLVLNGRKPSELPVEQPTKFELVVNLKTAAGLGLAIPAAIRLRADQVLQ